MADTGGRNWMATGMRLPAYLHRRPLSTSLKYGSVKLMTLIRVSPGGGAAAAVKVTELHSLCPCPCIYAGGTDRPSLYLSFTCSGLGFIFLARHPHGSLATEALEENII